MEDREQFKKHFILIIFLKFYLIFGVLLFKRELIDDFHLLLSKGVIFIILSSTYFLYAFRWNILNIGTTKILSVEDNKVKIDYFLKYGSLFSNLFFLEVLIRLLFIDKIHSSKYLPVFLILIQVENNFQLFQGFVMYEQEDWKSLLVFSIGSLFPLSLKKSLFLITNKILSYLTFRLIILHPRKIFDEIKSEYETIKNYIINFNVKFSCYDRNKKIKLVNPCTKKAAEMFGVGKFANAFLHTLTDEDVSTFNDLIKLKAFCTYTSLNPSFPDEIQENFQSLYTEEDPQVQKGVLHKVWDKILELKENYRNYTLFGVKKLRINEGNEIVLESFFRVNQNDDIEMMCLDIKDLLICEEERTDYKYKTIFLNKVAHEFKNPLLTINEIIKKILEEQTAEMNEK